MRNVLKRIRKLESARFDNTGLVPYSDAWFTFWEEKVGRLVDGEDVECRGFSIAVIDRIGRNRRSRRNGATKCRSNKFDGP
jgi:hypothetical protein